MEQYKEKIFVGGRDEASHTVEGSSHAYQTGA